MPFDKVPGMDDQHNFAPEVRQKIADSAELKATYSPLLPAAVPAGATPCYQLTTAAGTTLYDLNGTVL